MGAFQQPTAFSGKLTENYVLSGIFNMIISQLVFADNIDLDEGLVSLFRTDGTMYGDTKLYYATDIDKLWNFKEDTNRTVLTKMPPKDPKVQAVVIDEFKQTGITIDGTRLKQAFMGADVYGQFCTVTIQWLRETKRVLDTKLINTFVGTVETEAENSVVEIKLPKEPTDSIVEEDHWYKLIGGIVGRAIGNVAIDLKDALRTYNDYGFLRAYDLGEFLLVWNKQYDNLINHLSLPQIFHKDGSLATGFRNEVINDIYFGDLLTEAGTADGKTVRTAIDRVIDDRQYFPSDLLPEGTAYEAYEAYTEHSDFTDGAIICKLIHKRAIPFMSAMSIGTEFYNPKDLDRNHYLTWGYSKPTYLKNYPIVTFKAKFE